MSCIEELIDQIHHWSAQKPNQIKVTTCVAVITASIQCLRGLSSSYRCFSASNIRFFSSMSLDQSILVLHSTECESHENVYDDFSIQINELAHYFPTGTWHGRPLSAATRSSSHKKNFLKRETFEPSNEWNEMRNYSIWILWRTRKLQYIANRSKLYHFRRFHVACKGMIPSKMWSWFWPVGAHSVSSTWTSIQSTENSNEISIFFSMTPEI